LIIPITTFGLGCWQVRRRKWKINLIQTLNEHTTGEPRSLLDNLDHLSELEYYPIRVKGHYDHSKEILIEPRSRLDIEDKISNSQNQRNNPERSGGAQVITPFKVSNQNFSILVNRGFVPFDLRNPETRRAGQIEGEHEIVGLLRTTDSANVWMKNNPSKNLWRKRDVDEMARYLETAPIFIDAVKSSSVQGGPIGGQTNVQLRNEHLSYIVTWFSLSALTSLMWLKRYIL